MKILQVVQFFSPNHGGSARSSYELSKQLQKKGHDVTVLTTDFQMNDDFIDSMDGITVIPFHCQLNIGGILVSSSIEKYLKENIDKFDIIHMHNFRTYQNIITHKYAVKHNVPYILQARGSVLPFFQKQTLKKIFDIFFGYKILQDASKLIALTKIEAEQYTKMGVNKDKVEIVPNGINLNKYENLPIRGMFREKYGIKNDEKLILYLGRIHKIKGIDLLVSAFADLRLELDNVKLVIVGPDDGFLSTLKNQIEYSKNDEKILITGPLYEYEKLQAYVDADVYVLPSVYETFPNTVLEALACGTATIITDRCGIADIVANVVHVVEYEKVQLRNAIFEILSDGKLRRKFQEGGNNLFRREFDLNQIVKKVEGLYEDCIE